MKPSLLVRSYVLYFVFPLWVATGLADYFLHKHTRIEDTSGTKESVLHLLQLGEAGVPVVVALLFEINALVIGIMLFALLVHEATALWDTRTSPSWGTIFFPFILTALVGAFVIMPWLVKHLCSTSYSGFRLRFVHEASSARPESHAMDH